MPLKPQLSIIKGPQNEVIPCKLHELFEINLLKTTHKPVVIFKDKEINRTLTYQQVNERSNQYARALLQEVLEHSLKPNQDGDFIIGVCMEPSDDLVIILLAIWKAGVAYIAIDPILTANRIDHILKEARPMMVICDNDSDRKLFESSYALSLDELNEKAIHMDITNIPSDQMLKNNQDLAIILYTSGSTGVPKGVKLPHIALLNRLQWQWITIPFRGDESVGVFKTSLAFVDSVCEIWSILLHGLTLLVVPKATTKNPEKLVKLLDDYQIGRIVLVPALLRNIIMYLQMDLKTSKSSAQVLPNLKHWVCSGEPLQKHLVEQFFDSFEEGKHFLHNFYGSTEVMGDVTYFTCESKQQMDKFETIPIVLPIFNTAIYILDQNYEPVRDGDIGKMFVSGLGLANGYVNGRDPDRFFDNPNAFEDKKYSRLYSTGDFGSFRKGYINFEGRTDSQIKIRGHRVDLTEVEKTILAMAFVEKAIVLCHHEDLIDQTLLAFVQLKDSSPRFSELEIEIKKLQDYMIPQVMIVDHFPLLVNGKIDRQGLLRSYENTKNEAIAFDLSQVPDHMKPMATEMFNIVGGVIGCSTRGTLTVESNFYEMGGNSLNSMIVITLLREKGYHIEISDFISAKTLGDILQTIAHKLTTIQTEVEYRLPHLSMKAFPLTEDDKETCIKIFTDSFYEKGDLEYWIREEITRQEYVYYFENIWDDVLKKGYSFIVKDTNTLATIGVSINFDARDEPEFHMNSFADRAFDIVDVLEAPFRNNKMSMELNKVMHTSYSVTSCNLSPQENIACIYFIEEECLNLAKRKRFTGILSTNSSPLTQQLASYFEYKCLVDYQINEYIHEDGTNPYKHAPDSQRLMVHYKEL